METYEDLIAAEDVLVFVNAAITATGQREFRTDAAEQHLSLDFLHAYLLGNYRELYAATLALDINDHNAALIVRNLLVSAGEADPGQRRLEGRLIARRLALLPPQRVYRLFGDLRRARVNNRRTRAIVRDWLAARPAPALDAVKYRAGLKGALRHAHLTPQHPETGRFLFGKGKAEAYREPLLDAWRRAHYEQSAIYELPFTVAEGFAAKHGLPRGVFLAKIEPRLTRLERLRLQESTRAAGAAPAIELGRMPLTRLASYVLGLPVPERVARRAELDGALRAAAARTAGGLGGTWGRVAAVLDDSFSSYGSGQKRRRPLAAALASHYLLGELGAHYRGFWTSGRTDALLAHPGGPTPLGLRILDALDWAPDRLVIVSDGWDNAPPGLAAEVLRVWRTRLDPQGRTAVVHLNPVYDAEDFDVRRLAPGVPTAGLRDAEDLPSLVELAGFAEGRTGLAELRAHLAARVAAFLGAASPDTAAPDPASPSPATPDPATPEAATPEAAA
jgi:hypothetical protein